ncbi:MAG: glycosyl hydrolase 53 family protein, partial [Bacteroidales bacterium]|nr:glycosyl hydrolase 53 family protein [Bacteroidales bacterium]
MKHLLCILASCFMLNSALAQSDNKDFVKGADVGSLSSQVDRGIKFHDRNGQERECLDLLKDYQISAIRLRVWVNPKEKYCGKEDVLRQALLAKEMGMDVMIDFHYSDWWADPAKQPIPESWEKLSYRKMKKALHAHTVEVLSLLKEHGVTPRWVQV